MLESGSYVTAESFVAAVSFDLACFDCLLLALFLALLVATFRCNGACHLGGGVHVLEGYSGLLSRLPGGSVSLLLSLFLG